MSAGISGQEFPLWAEFSFLNLVRTQTNICVPCWVVASATDRKDLSGRLALPLMNDWPGHCWTQHPGEGYKDRKLVRNYSTLMQRTPGTETGGNHAPRLMAPEPFWKRALQDTLSGPVLRDTARLSQRYPPIARYGVFGVSTWPIGCDTPSPFSERYPLESMQSGGRYPPPPQKGYLRDTSAIPYENTANGCDTPLCDTISKGCCAIGGGYLALGR